MDRKGRPLTLKTIKRVLGREYSGFSKKEAREMAEQRIEEGLRHLAQLVTRIYLEQVRSGDRAPAAQPNKDDLT